MTRRREDPGDHPDEETLRPGLKIMEKREGKHAIKQGGEDFSIYDLPLLVSRTICDSYNSFATAETIDGSPDQGDEKPCTSTAPTRAVDAVPVQDDGRIGNTREESAPDNDGDKI